MVAPQFELALLLALWIFTEEPVFFRFAFFHCPLGCDGYGKTGLGVFPASPHDQWSHSSLSPIAKEFSLSGKLLAKNHPDDHCRHKGKCFRDTCPQGGQRRTWTKSSCSPANTKYNRSQDQLIVYLLDFRQMKPRIQDRARFSGYERVGDRKYANGSNHHKRKCRTPFSRHVQKSNNIVGNRHAPDDEAN
jgi:hypothetical protein